MPRPSPQTGDVADLHFEATARHNKSRIPSSRLNNNYGTDSSDVAYTPPSSEEHTALPHRKIGHTMPSTHPRLENNDDGARERVARHITVHKLAKNNPDTAFDGHSTSSSEVNGRYGQSQERSAQRECDFEIYSSRKSSMVSISRPHKLDRIANRIKLRDQSYRCESKARGFQGHMPSWNSTALEKPRVATS